MTNSIVRAEEVERFREIVEVTDLGRLPFSDGQNHMLRSSQLNEMPRMYWSPVLHMIYHSVVSEEKMIAVFKVLTEEGFHLKQVLKL